MGVILMEWLKGLLEDKVENVDEVMEQVKSEFPKHAIPKEEYNKKAEKVKELESELNTAKTNLETTNETIEQLKEKAENAEEVKTKLNEVSSKYEEYKEQEEQRISNLKKESAVKDLLHEENADSKLSKLLIKDVDFDNVELSDDGKIANRDDVINPLKQEYETAFGEVKIDGDEPQDGGTTQPNSYRAKYKQAMENGNRREAIKIKQQAFKEGKTF